MERITCPNCCGYGRFRNYYPGSSGAYTICWKCGGRGYIDVPTKP